jgi:membrane fusion protein (multidrug efflux system)
MPERYVGDLHQSAEVAVSTTAFPGETVSGKVRVVDPVVDPSTRNVRVIARLHNPGERFRPGMSANVEVVLAARDSALTVPSEAVFAEGAAFLVDKVGPDGTVMPAPVTLGIRLPDVVEVTSGLSSGDTVVRAGQQKLFPGAKVMPIEAGAQGAPGAPGAPGAAAAPGGAKAAGGDSSQGARAK